MKREKRVGKVAGEWFAGLNNFEVLAAALVASSIGAITAIPAAQQPTQSAYYASLKQAPWAPPGWVFGPVWTSINFILLLGLRRTLRSQGVDRRRLLWLQVGIWGIFFSFNYVYFQKRSPVLAAVWTKADAILALCCILVAMKRDRRLAWHFYRCWCGRFLRVRLRGTKRCGILMTC